MLRRLRYWMESARRSESLREEMELHGSLYPALQRLELNGWIDGAWGVTAAGRQKLAIARVMEAE
jgi:DNA-binding PadR family transcriptional regulator